MVSFSFIFPKGIFNSIAIVLTVLGIIAHIGMCAIDFQLWSYGEDYASRSELIERLRKTTSIWLPFMSIGPSLLYIGISIHAWKFTRSHPKGAILTMVGAITIGLGQIIQETRVFIILGYVLFALGLILLMYKNIKLKPFLSTSKSV
jgi:hypothetical protein